MRRLRLTFTLGNKTWFPWLFVGGCVFLLPSVLLLQPEKRFEAIVAVVAAVGGFTHFLYSQHQEEVRLFRDLFTDFTRRYDGLNNALNEIRMRAPGSSVSDTDQRRLYDYFNLCAEEYLFYQAGYLDEQVWRAWCRGMMIFAQIPEIRAVWDAELKTASYYGFSLDRIQCAAEIP